MKYVAQIGDQSFEISLIDGQRLSVDGEVFRFDVARGVDPEHFLLILDGRSYQLWIKEGERRQSAGAQPLRVNLQGFDYDVRVEDERARQLRQITGSDARSNGVEEVLAPMPGLVVKLLVERGQSVQKGEGLVIVEAMKMENEIRSPVSGEVREIRVGRRQAVEKGEVLALIG